MIIKYRKDFVSDETDIITSVYKEDIVLLSNSLKEDVLYIGLNLNYFVSSSLMFEYMPSYTNWYFHDKRNIAKVTNGFEEFLSYLKKLGQTELVEYVLFHPDEFLNKKQRN